MEIQKLMQSKEKLTYSLIVGFCIVVIALNFIISKNNSTKFSEPSIQANQAEHAMLLGFPIKENDLICVDGSLDKHDENWDFVKQVLEEHNSGVFYEMNLPEGSFSVVVRTLNYDKKGWLHYYYLTRFTPKIGQPVWSFREAYKNPKGWHSKLDFDVLGVARK